jgi:hypothetical protein
MQDFNLNDQKSLQIYHMKPKKPANKHRQRELFRVELIQIIDPGHGLVKLANAVDWDQLQTIKAGLKSKAVKAHRLKRINAILSAAGMNFAKLLRRAADFLRLFYCWLFGCQRALFAKPTN